MEVTMNKRNSFAASLTGAIALAALLSTPVFAGPQMNPNTRIDYRADRISTAGRISSITREGDMVRITLDHGSYGYLVPFATVRNRNLQVGSFVRLSGIIAGDVVNVDMLALRGEPYYTADPNYVAVPYGTNGWMTGTVQSLDRHLGYLTIREDTSDAMVKIDVRHLNTRRPINVWSIRPGDRITINGTWEKQDTFDANRIEY
jgi:hypothetical protein